MKNLRLISLAALAALLVGCEATGQGNQETKRAATLEQERQEPQHNIGTRNLWGATNDVLRRDGNPNNEYDSTFN